MHKSVKYVNPRICTHYLKFLDNENWSKEGQPAFSANIHLSKKETEKPDKIFSKIT